MAKAVVQWEESRLNDIEDVTESAAFRERHRVFPAVFEGRKHRRILDVAAGVGYIAKRVQESYPSEVICNDISPTCLSTLKQKGLATVSFDLDDENTPFPFDDGSFDAVIATVVIEHIIAVDHFLDEIRRILSDDGCLYLSAPNYTGLMYLPQFLIKGKTFHDPLSGPLNRYEFYSHVRYYTYNTLLEFVSTFGFTPEAVYLAAPQASSNYQRMYSSSRLKAMAFRNGMKMMYKLLPPRWAAEPIVCFRKGTDVGPGRLRKVVL